MSIVHLKKKEVSSAMYNINNISVERIFEINL